MPQDLVCIIVHHGDPMMTRDCVASLLGGIDPPQVIVVCNTTENDTESLARILSRGGIDCQVMAAATATPGQAGVWIIPAGANLGFAKACNLGIALTLRTCRARWLWLLNNDTLVEAQAPAMLRNCLENQTRAIIGSAIVRHGEPERLELVLGCRFSPVTSVLRPQSPGALLHKATQQSVQPVDYVYGASFAFPVDLIREIGFLCDAFFLYYEEFDFCLRARRAGYAFHWCPSAVVRHGTGQDRPASRQDRALRHHHETLSTFLFMRRHYRWALWTALPIRTVAKLILLPLRGEAWLLPSYCSGLAAFFRSIAAHGGAR